MRKQISLSVSSQSRTTVLQTAHVTKVYGPVQSLAKFISEKKRFDFCQIIHPLNNNASPESVFLRNGKKISEVRINTYSIFRYFLDFIITSYWLFKLPKKIDIGFGMNSFDTLPLVIFRHKINKIVFFNTDFARNRFNNKLINSIYVSIDKYCAQKADLVCCNTNRTINARIDEGINKNKLLLTPNGVNFDKIGKIKPKTKYSKSLIYVGYLSKEHGLQTVIKELPKLDLKLIVIGSGEYERKLKNLVKKLNLDDSVTFLGNLKHQQVINILKKFGGFGLAPYNNSSEWTYYCDPVKIKEYLACYVPVIISSRPEVSETIAREKLGFRYTNEDEIKTILEKVRKMSEKEYKETQENISKFRNEFNLNTIYQNMWQRINQPTYIHE